MCCGVAANAGYSSASDGKSFSTSTLASSPARGGGHQDLHSHSNPRLQVLDLHLEPTPKGKVTLGSIIRHLEG